MTSVLCLSVAVAAQPAIRLADGGVRLTSSGLSFITGPMLARLRDGRSVRFDLELVASSRPGGAAIAQVRQACLVSYDLWEERFAVAMAGATERPVFHVKPAEAESWCVDRVAIPAALLSASEPFWLRLEYRVSGEPSESRESTATLRGLVDRLSRRRGAEARDLVDAGPFTLPH